MPDTATVIMLDALQDELQAHLPAALATYGMPAVEQWDFGQTDLVAVTKTPCVQVDISAQTQVGLVGPTAKQQSNLIVIAIIAAPDSETLHRRLISFADIIAGTIEANVTVGGMSLFPVDKDYSPSLSRGNSLLRAVAIECELRNIIRPLGGI